MTTVLAATLILLPIQVAAYAQGHSTLTEDQAKAEKARVFAEALDLEVGQQNPRSAINTYKQLVSDYPGTDPVVGKALVRIAICETKIGNFESARDHLQAVINRGDIDPQTTRRARRELKRVRSLTSAPTSTDSKNLRSPTETPRPQRDRIQDSGRNSAIRRTLQDLLRKRLIHEQAIQKELEAMASQLDAEGYTPENMRVEFFLRRTELVRKIEQEFEQEAEDLRFNLSRSNRPVEVERQFQHMRELMSETLKLDYPFRGALLTRIENESNFRSRLRKRIEQKQDEGASPNEIGQFVHPYVSRFYRSQTAERRTRTNERVLELKEMGLPPTEIRHALNTFSQVCRFLGIERAELRSVVRSLVPGMTTEVRRQTDRRKPGISTTKESQEIDALRLQIAEKNEQIRLLEQKLREVEKNKGSKRQDA